LLPLRRVSSDEALAIVVTPEVGIEKATVRRRDDLPVDLRFVRWTGLRVAPATAGDGWSAVPVLLPLSLALTCMFARWLHLMKDPFV
jgi:hypothetical protein